MSCREGVSSRKLRRHEKAGAVRDPGLKALRRAGYLPASFALAVAHPLTVVGDVVVPVSPNHVASLTAVDRVPPVAVAHVYEVAPLLCVHAVAIPPEALSIDVVVASPSDNVVVKWGLR